MDAQTFTSLTLLGIILLIIIFFVCHYMGPRTTFWISNKEEKIGLSKNKLFHANGYMVSSSLSSISINKMYFIIIIATFWF